MIKMRLQHSWIYNLVPRLFTHQVTLNNAKNITLKSKREILSLYHTTNNMALLYRRCLHIKGFKKVYPLTFSKPFME
jgi:hypothetical protein